MSQTWGTIGAALIGLAGIILSLRQSTQKSKTDAAQALFNELQEERAELKAERKELRERVDRIEERERIRDDYIQELRQHIRLGLPPPPPPWPEGIRNG
jgi:cell division protein FtsB